MSKRPPARGGAKGSRLVFLKLPADSGDLAIRIRATIAPTPDMESLEAGQQRILYLWDEIRLRPFNPKVNFTFEDPSITVRRSTSPNVTVRKENLEALLKKKAREIVRITGFVHFRKKLKPLVIELQFPDVFFDKFQH